MAMNIKKYDVKNTLLEHKETIEKIINSNEIIYTIDCIANLLIEKLSKGNKILLAGNGGSASDSQHMCGELVGKLNFDRKGLPAISLTADNAIITAISNDYSFEDVFSRQIQALCNKEDVVMLYSTSGNSMNIINAINQAKFKGGVVIGFSGLSGGNMSNKCDYLIRVPSTSTQRIQESHHLINHIICEKVEGILFQKD